jgi:hypothetical protein
MGLDEGKRETEESTSGGYVIKRVVSKRARRVKRER